MMNDSEIVDTLNTLLETSRDGELGFENCARYVEATQLKTLFSQRATECHSAASALGQLITQYGGKPDEDGTLSGALHRGWVNVRGAVTGQDDVAMLEECERGEDVAKARYRKALEQPLPEPVRSIVQQQYDGVLRNHDQVRSLREQYRAAN